MRLGETPCAYCGSGTRDVFCSPECEQNHQRFDRVLLHVDVDIVMKLHQFSRDAGSGYAATWDRMLRVALDRVGAPL